MAIVPQSRCHALPHPIPYPDSPEPAIPYQRRKELGSAESIGCPPIPPPGGRNGECWQRGGAQGLSPFCLLFSARPALTGAASAPPSASCSLLEKQAFTPTSACLWLEQKPYALGSRISKLFSLPVLPYEAEGVGWGPWPLVPCSSPAPGRRALLDRVAPPRAPPQPSGSCDYKGNFPPLLPVWCCPI